MVSIVKIISQLERRCAEIQAQALRSRANKVELVSVRMAIRHAEAELYRLAKLRRVI